MTDLVRAAPSGLIFDRTNPYARLVEDFLRGRSIHTVRAYRRDLNLFAWFVHAKTQGTTTNILDDTGQPAVTKTMEWFLGLTPGNAHLVTLEWKNHMIETRLASATINRRLMSLRSIVASRPAYGDGHVGARRRDLARRTRTGDVGSRP